MRMVSIQQSKTALWLGCLSAIVGLSLTLSGCDSSGKNQGANSGASSNDHDHDHDHEEHADHGPNHGHLITDDSEEFGLEWTHSSKNNIIRVFLLDSKNEKNQAAKADSVTVTRATGNSPDKWVLAPVNANEAGETAEYMLDSEDLNRAMALGVNVEVKIGDKVVTGKIPPHAPHDH